MLSITHPVVMQYVNELAVGLLPVIFKGDPVPRLVVKASKELALSAKLRRSFCIHLVPYDVAGVKSVGFIASFFDDQRHPLVICGVLAKELLGYEFCHLLMSSEVNVHFFDELGREVVGYKARFAST